MSTTAAVHPAIDAICGALDANLHMYLCDWRAMPEDKLNQSPMGHARTPVAFTAEVIGVNFACAAILRDEPSLSEAEAMAKYSNIGKEDGERLLQESCQALKDAAYGLSEEDLNAEVTAPWGAPCTKLRLLGFLPYHLSYHDGQLNYLHAMYGDTKIHWH
jgi:hypothetical protein